MFLAYLLFALLAVVVLIVGRRWRRSIRITVALLVLLVPSAVMTIRVVAHGDPPPPDALTVHEPSR